MPISPAKITISPWNHEICRNTGDPKLVTIKSEDRGGSQDGKGRTTSTRLGMSWQASVSWSGAEKRRSKALQGRRLQNFSGREAKAMAPTWKQRRSSCQFVEEIQPSYWILKRVPLSWIGRMCKLQSPVAPITRINSRHHGKIGSDSIYGLIVRLQFRLDL